MLALSEMAPVTKNRLKRVPLFIDIFKTSHNFFMRSRLVISTTFWRRMIARQYAVYFFVVKQNEFFIIVLVCFVFSRRKEGEHGVQYVEDV